MDVTADLERAALNTLGDAIISAFDDDDDDENDGDHESYDQQAPILNDYININLNEFHSLSTDEVEANLLNECPKNDDGDGAKSDEEEFIGFNDDVILKSISINNEQNAHDAGNKDGSNNDSRDNDDRDNANGDNDDRDNDKLQSSGDKGSYIEMEINSRNVTENSNDMEELNIKMEFTCESEKIIENQIEPEYFIHNYDDNNEIEIYSTSQSPELGANAEENDELENLLTTSNDSMREFLKFPIDHLNLKDVSVAGNEDEKKTTVASECVKSDDLIENLEISSIMSDHNYTSQEINAPENTLRHNLINHILNKTTPSTATSAANINNKITPEVTEFVEKILESINTFQILDDDNEKQKCNINSKDAVVDKSDTYDDDDRDLFVQNIIDAVIAEDYAEYAESKAIELNSSANKSEKIKKCEDMKVEKPDAVIKKEVEIVEISATDNNYEINEIIAAAAEAEDTLPKGEEISSKAEVTSSKAEETLSKAEKTSQEDETLSNAEPFNNTKSLDKIKDQLETTSTENFMISPDIPATTSLNSLKTVTLSKVEESETEFETDIEMQENCSEPLEHMQFEEAFDLLSTSSKSSKNKLDLLTAFAKVLYNDCVKFATSKMNIDDKLQKYIKEQFHIFKSLACNQNDYIEQSQQTDPKKPKLSARKLRKLNKKNKKVLLESSSDSSSTDSSSTCGDSDATVLNTEIVIPTAKKLRNKVKVEDVCAPPPINNEAVAEEEIKLSQIYAKDDDDVESSANHEETEKKPFDEYDDGVSLAKYIQSEIFETDSNSNDSHLTMSSMRRYENNDDDIDDDISVNTGGEGNGTKQKHLDIDNNNEILNESDKENASSISKKKEKDKKNKKLAESSDEDENDKEIERLINLNALSKRPPTSVGSMKSAETTKKIKAQSIKSKNNIVDFSDDDGAIGVPSNESMSEDEEEVITEEQYLARYNENLKQQLLNGSSSDSEEVEDDLNDVLDEVISDEDGNKSPLIDKFLKSYNVEESDEEENEAQTETTEESLPAQASTSLYLNGVEENATGSGAAADDDKSLGLKKSNLSNTPDNSDCELLNESLLFRKRTRPKTLEKMLSEADKRKKISKIDEDLISLSSESECSSGVEAVEETNNSRILKPMLRQDQLAGETRKAQKHETDRIRRLEKKQTMMAKATKEHADLIKSGDLILDYIDETKTFIKVHPGIVKHLKKHQFEGVKFMYDSCYGGVEALKKNSGSGCILAHCMGLGKTLQLIALLHTVITFKELKTTKILVLCPKSTVMNWADEVVRWLGPINAKNLKVYTFNDTSDINEKLSVMREWSMSNHTKAGCLLIGYEAFRTLVFYHSYKNRGNISAARLEDIRDKVDKYLLQPGADLVVCDEGHIIKNSKSAISLAVAKIVTPKRIILTGTPIQNNLKEYYSMVNFIKPLFLGTEKEFANLYANPIKNGQHKDSNKRDIKVMKQRSFVLHKKLSKFVQRKEAALLKTFLPQKFEYVLFIPMTAVQNNLYEYILEAIQRRDDNRGKSLITDYTCLRKIWTHPKVLEDAWKNATQKYKRDQKRNLLPHSDDDQPDDIYDSQTGVMSVTNDWWRHLVTPNDLETILPSNKLRTMFEILRVCEEKGEKCLIFSAFVAVLNVVEYFFSKISDSDPETLKQLNIKDNKAKHSWISGQDYYRLDGKTSKSIRHEMVKRFNSPNNKRARVFLISAKAGGQGINLIGANRVIILDTSWNPSNDQQNIFRIFRLGQKKNCYIYRVIAMGTMEEKVYSRSVTKQAMSFRVVDEQQIDRHYSMAELAELYTLTVPNYAERPMPVFPQDSILASLLLNYPDLVYKYHEHDSLLENKVEQELSEQEKADAWAAYEKDLQLSSEIRELSNFDDLQNNFAASSKMQNYLSTLPGFDQMQSFLNYGALGQQTAALSPFMQSFLSQYNYSTQNQQYMEMMYKRMAQSTSMGAGAYPDINSSLASMAAAAGSSGVYNSAAAAAAYTQSASKPPSSPSTASLLSSLHASGLSASPLSALGDLSMYGLGGSSGMGSMGISSKATLPHSSNPVASMSPHPSMSPHHPSMSPHHQYQQHQHSAASSLFGLPAPPTSSNASNMNTNTAAASSLLSSFGQYKQSLESAFPNFSNYRNDYQNTNAAVVAAATAAANKSKMSQSSNAHMNPYISNYHHLSSTPPQANNNSVQSRDGSSSSYSASNFANASKQQLPPPPPAVPQSPTDSQSKRQQVAESELAAERLIRKLMEQHSNVSGSSGGGAVSNRSSPNIASTNEQPRATAALTQKRNNTPTQQMTTAKPPPTTSTQHLQQLRPKTNSPAQQPMNSKANTSMQQQQHSVSSKSNTAMQQSGGASKSSMEQTGATKSTQQLSNSKTAVSNSAVSANASKTTTPTITQKQTGTSLYGALRGGANMFATSSTTKSNSSAATTSNTTTTVAPPLNMGILYPNGSSSAAAAASAELLKANKEMQIIPTTSPPGPPQNISKFNELSPSISLTAVRQTTKQSATTAAAATTTTKQQLMQNLSNKKSNSNINVSSNNSSSNNNNKINKHITQAAAATANKAIPNNNKKSQNQLAMKQIYSTSMPSISSSSAAYNTASANLKTALAAAVVAKSSSSASGNAKHVQAANQKSLVHSSASSSAAPFPTAIKKNIKKLPPITAAQLMQSSKNVAGGGSARTSSPVATSVNTFYTTPQQASSSGSRSTVQPSANFRTIQKALTKDHPNRTSPNSAQRPTNSPTITQVQKRASLNAAAVASVTTATKATAVRVSTPTLTSASSASTAATKNSFNIRPVNIKQNPSGTGVYIIETNINQKKVAIGAPTKSGGGTTVTKVPLKGKRNVNDSKDISLNETKRSKLE